MAHQRFNHSFPYPFELTAPVTFGNLPLSQPLYQPTAPNIAALLNLRNNLQAQLLQLQIANLVQTNMAALASSIKSYTSTSESVTSHSSTETKPTSANLTGLPEDSDICLEARVKYMLQFFINNFGRVTENDIKAERQKFASDERLVKVFDCLVAKYSATTKTREEMIKWIIRRAIKCSKQNMKANNKANPKDTSKELCKKYFKGNQVKYEDDGDCEWVDSMLPFRKNAKNKTMNANFISEIFESEEFRDDYKRFLNDFDGITEKDTIKKVSKFSCFLVECVKSGTIGGIAKYKRVPWLRVWIQNTKKVAMELEEGNFDERSSKKVKSEDSESL